MVKIDRFYIDIINIYKVLSELRVGTYGPLSMGYSTSRIASTASLYAAAQGGSAMFLRSRRNQRQVEDFFIKKDPLVKADRKDVDGQVMETRRGERGVRIQDSGVKV